MTTTLTKANFDLSFEDALYLIDNHIDIALNFDYHHLDLDVADNFVEFLKYSCFPNIKDGTATQEEYSRYVFILEHSLRNIVRILQFYSYCIHPTYTNTNGPLQKDFLGGSSASFKKLLAFHVFESSLNPTDIKLMSSYELDDLIKRYAILPEWLKQSAARFINQAVPVYYDEVEL